MSRNLISLALLVVGIALLSPLCRPNYRTYKAWTWPCQRHGGNHTSWTMLSPLYETRIIETGLDGRPIYPRCQWPAPGPPPQVIDLGGGRNVTLPSVAVNGTLVSIAVTDEPPPPPVVLTLTPEATP